MNKDFAAMIAAKKPQPLSSEDREKIRISHGDSWKFSPAARYEATIVVLEDRLGKAGWND